MRCCRTIWMNGCGNTMNHVRTAGNIAMGKRRCRHSWIPYHLQKRKCCSIVATFQTKRKYDGSSDDVVTSTFFADMTKLKADFSAQIRVICSDMWKPYLKIIVKHLPQAINVLDRFHIMQKFGKALDKVRADEAKRLRQAKQPPLLSKSRWCFLKRRKT